MCGARPHTPPFPPGLPLRGKGTRPPFGNEKAGRDLSPPSRSPGRARTRLPQGAVQPAPAPMKEMRAMEDSDTDETDTLSSDNRNGKSILRQLRL